MPEENGKNAEGEAQRRCFVVSAFGTDAEEQKRQKQVLRHLVQKVLGGKFQVVRADEIDDEGLITNQIIEHLIDDDLVVADLTGLNPNVFYEVAVRHAARKPIVHLITAGQEIPFDVANMRAVPYALDDPDALEVAQGELERKVQAIEESGWKAAPNPISVALDVWLLQESEQPEAREMGDVLAAVGELRDEVRGLARRVPMADDPTAKATPLKEAVATYLHDRGPSMAAEAANALSASQAATRNALHRLEGEGRVTRLDSGLWASKIPF